MNTNIFRNLIFIVKFLAVIICLFFWIMNDFDNNLYEFCSKTIVVCVCFDLSFLIFKKINAKRSMNHD